MYPDTKARPHLARTWILLALIGALAIAGLMAISYLFGPVKVKLPAGGYTGPEPTQVFETPAVNR